MGRTYYLFSFLPSPFLLSRSFESALGVARSWLISQWLTNQLPSLGQTWALFLQWVSNNPIMTNPISAWSLGPLSATRLVTAHRLNISKGQKGAERGHSWELDPYGPDRNREERCWEQGFPLILAGPGTQPRLWSSETEVSSKAEALVCG